MSGQGVVVAGGNLNGRDSRVYAETMTALGYVSVSGLRASGNRWVRNADLR